MGNARSTSQIESDELKAVKKLREAREAILGEIRKVIVGQDEVIELVLIALFSQGHCLLIGVPGLAKTLLVNSIAKVLDLSFKRIQFTPDLMPADIIGTDILQEDAQTGRRIFEFAKGPIFANIILADEINRAPPKTQSALLEAMQEYRVTAGGRTYELPMPFFVLATQNPIELEGTYPLPEAQLDRFMFAIVLDYPSHDEEKEIVRLTTSARNANLSTVMGAKEILEVQALVRKVPAPEHVIDYATRLVRSTRPQDKLAPEFVRRWISWGAGPRASQCLILGAKARAIVMGRHAASIEDVKAIAHSVLRHRIVLSYSAESEGVVADQIISRLIEHIHEVK
ncbi:MAG: MoxR family ATPase [Armatimonadota bacterium]|nr:MoxR family ATPase [Armatimonadota bacterium]MDW8025087.1 MoxR family ATPase [Armatimonadota bacterium]